MSIAKTPQPPYYAVIFSNELSEETTGYEEMALKMSDLAEQQPGFLGMESVRNGLGITVSYWASLEDIQQWRQQIDHMEAQKMGKEKWYQRYSLRICQVERDYRFEK